MKLMDNLTIGDRVRARRDELGLTQDDLAERAGYCNKTAISKLEHAGNELSMKQVRRLASALDCTMEYLMGWQIRPDTKLSDTHVSTSDIPAAIDLYASYKAASPEKQMAIDVLLKDPQQAALSQRLQQYSNAEIQNNS